MTFQTFLNTYSLRLDPQQAEAVQAVKGNVLLLAVPGSGKTTVLVARLGYMILALGIPRQEILTMTYTVAATEDMRRRFTAFFGAEEPPEFRTINGVSARIIQAYERLYDRQAFPLIEPQEQAALLSALYLEQTGDYLSESTRRTIQSGITYIKNRMLTPEEIEEFRPERIHLAPLYRAYCGALRQQKRMDYDDQMVYALKILKTCPAVLSEFHSTYRYLCVDEAQDTSKIQHELIRMLTSGNLFMVGDEDQSIYGFRAAYPEALAEFPKRYPDARLLVLEQNYRSTPQIVAAADRFIQGNHGRHPKAMRAARGEGRAVHAIRIRNRTAQYHYLVKVAEDCDRETAVLFRNNDSALPMIDLLERAGLPYRCARFDTAFFSHPTVTDTLDILQFAKHPADADLFLTLYYKFNAAITKAAAKAAAERSRTTGRSPLRELAEDADLSDYSRERCRSLLLECDLLWERTADEALHHIAYEMGYRSHLTEFGMDPSRLEILQIIARELPSPAALVERLSELEAIAARGICHPESNFLLSTIHSAKGLEYDRVFLADAIDGILPGAEDGEEERRLFYVGMTRAVNELHIFRFTEPGLSTAFADEVFRPTAQKSAAPILSRDRLTPGTAVIHSSFGAGTVTALQGGILTVRFPEGEKHLSLEAVLKPGLLTLGDSL